MRRLCIATLALAGQIHLATADETVTTVDGRQFLLRSNGTYEVLKNEPTAASATQYKRIPFEDFKLDIGDLDGQHVEVRAKLQTFGDMVMISDPKSMFDGNPIMANQEKLTREERRRILRCDEGCNVTVKGEVAQVMFQPGIILHSLEK